MGFPKGISLKENVIVWLEFKLVGILNGKSILIEEQQFLLWKDTTLYLFVDEIHLKPYFNYKGGNIIGLSDNSNEAVTNAFDFMLSNQFSQYKDFVHVMPTKYLKSENLFDVVKCIKIRLKEIGFQVLSIITDNNFAQVQEYINLFYIWWTIMNVKTPYKSCRLRKNTVIQLSPNIFIPGTNFRVENLLQTG